MDQKNPETPFRPNASGMTMTRFIAMSSEARKVWLESTAHSYDCTAHSEGQMCCLEKLIEEEGG